MESLVFFVTWEAVKDRREVDTTLIVRGHMRLRTEKGTKVAGNLLHVSSYRVSNIIHTERWSIVGWTTRKTLPFWFVIFWLHHAYVEKIPRSPHDTYSFQESLGTRLDIITRMCKQCVPGALSSPRLRLGMRLTMQHDYQAYHTYITITKPCCAYVTITKHRCTSLHLVIMATGGPQWYCQFCISIVHVRT